MSYPFGGVDVSYAQGNYIPVGLSFVIVNASRANIGYAVGSYYHVQVDNARRQRCEVGHYFFNGNVDPVEAADYFCDNLYDYRPGDSVWIDSESEASTGTVAWGPAQCAAFVDRVRSRLKTVAGIYLNKSLMVGNNWSPLVARGCPLWLAYYDTALPALAWWAEAVMWQHASLPMDLDVASKTQADIAGAPPAPTPTPTIIPGDGTVILLENGGPDGSLLSGQIYWATDNGDYARVDLAKYPAGTNSVFVRPILEKTFGPIVRHTTKDLASILSTFDAVKAARAASAVDAAAIAKAVVAKLPAAPDAVAVAAAVTEALADSFAAVHSAIPTAFTLTGKAVS